MPPPASTWGPSGSSPGSSGPSCRCAGPPRPWGAAERDALRALRGPALVLAAMLAAAWIAWFAVRARNREPLPAAVDGEAAMLSSPDVMACRSPVPVVALAGLEHDA